VADQRGVPTTSAFLAEKTLALLAKDATGLLHLVPAGETTWYDFAREIVQLTGSTSEVQPIKTGEFPVAARRPANSVLDNRKAAAVLGVPMPDWRTLVRGVRESAEL
jgi:dTDP-4-dehydrorhamnose reductase